MTYVAGFLLLVIVLLGGYGWYQDKQIAALNLENQNLTIELEVEQANVAQLEDEIDLVATQVGQFQEKIAQIEAERATAREQVEYTRSLFNDHDFAKLMAAKPGLITTRMQNATDKVFADLRAITE
jgi:putative ubiquitin-RnfH superfamily antitoxin RatB of RatAB toxin-antitoxin module